MEIIDQKTKGGHERTLLRLEIPFRIEFCGRKDSDVEYYDAAKSTLEDKTTNLFELVKILGRFHAESSDFEDLQFGYYLELLGLLGEGFLEAIENLEIQRSKIKKAKTDILDSEVLR